jgi:hypothetical protein
MCNIKRSDLDCFKIVTLAQEGMDYRNMGYVSDLQFCQGEESIFKAKRLAEKMSKDKGNELINLVYESNARMEGIKNGKENR